MIARAGFDDALRVEARYRTFAVGHAAVLLMIGLERVCLSADVAELPGAGFAGHVIAAFVTLDEREAVRTRLRIGPRPDGERVDAEHDLAEPGEAV